MEVAEVIVALIVTVRVRSFSVVVVMVVVELVVASDSGGG